MLNERPKSPKWHNPLSVARGGGRKGHSPTFVTNTRHVKLKVSSGLNILECWIVYYEGRGPHILSGAMNVLILQCCVFFLSVYTRTCRNNDSMSNFGGGFRWQIESSRGIEVIFLKFTIVFNSTRKNEKKIKGKREFLRKTIKFFTFFDVNKKILDDQKILKIVYNSNFYEICRKRENLQYKSVDKIFLAQSKYLKTYCKVPPNSNIDKNSSKP
ncbi:Uncharacterized protein FWK35_00009956 [Aphis craccivora]|uniref:Uncharacterized protein n=1 Tax=Aphis craccivora TaxID=307492 RepID=A0A6G0YBY9_APHCR|nr:Uncharacterized protein FWK35_00009956 [Aphis craccivora]